jgi:N utilization substance protein A
VPIEELAGVEGFDDEIANELRSRAKDALLTQALASEEGVSGETADDLLNMEGMDTALASELAKLGVFTMEDLAEQATDELMELEGMEEQRAAALIMTARAPWFEETES